MLHRRSVLDVWRDVEVADVQLVHSLHLHVGEGWVIRGGDELAQLFFIIDIRKCREDGPMCVEPEKCQLADGHAALPAQRLETLDLLQAFHQPGPRSMRTVIALVELRLQRVLPLQQPGGMRNPRKELRWSLGLPRAEGWIERAARLADFLVRFPLAKDLLQIIDTTVGTQTYRTKQVASGEQLSKLIETARAVPVATHIKEYAVRLLLATHSDQEDAPEKVRNFVRYGASPRGLQAIIMTAKVRALLEGRYNVSQEDLREVAFPALRHRIIPNFDGLTEGITPEEVIEEIIKETEDTN